MGQSKSVIVDMIFYTPSRAIGYSLKVMLINLCCIIALFICGCGTVGRPFDIEKASQIKSGVATREDIIVLFGKPYSDLTYDDTENIMYLYANASGKSQTLSIGLGKDNKVFLWNTAIIVNGCKSRKKPIDMTEVNKIKVGTTTEDEVISLLGKPTIVTADSFGERTLSYAFGQHEKKSEITPVDIATVGLVGALLQRKTVELQGEELIVSIGPAKKVVNVSKHTMKINP
jgi:outer membrane protein assembly factor BamE (lipoprotein component of BamABCDE complex)